MDQANKSLIPLKRKGDYFKYFSFQEVRKYKISISVEGESLSLSPPLLIPANVYQCDLFDPRWGSVGRAARNLETLKEPELIKPRLGRGPDRGFGMKISDRAGGGAGAWERFWTILGNYQLIEMQRSNQNCFHSPASDDERL